MKLTPVYKSYIFVFFLGQWESLSCGLVQDLDTKLMVKGRPESEIKPGSDS